MRVLFFLVLMSVSCAATAQNGFNSLYIRDALAIAKEEGTFVLAYFSDRPISCVGCELVWRTGILRDSVDEVQNRFISTWIDSRYSNIDMQEYGIKSLPTVLILDGNGREYFRKLGDFGGLEALRIFNEYPKDMSAVYAADSIAQEKPKDFMVQLNLAKAYQEVAREAIRPVSGQLAGYSDLALKKASKILTYRRVNLPHAKEIVKLMMAENLLLKNRSKKALTKVAVLEKKLDESNLALAYYIKGSAYRKMNLTQLAEEYYDKLQQASDNEAFLALYRKGK